MADWVYVLIDCLLFVGVMTVGFLIGHVHGHYCGWSKSSKYHKGYRHEDGEIIGRLRGRIIWLEAGIKRTRELIEKAQMCEIAAGAALTSASLELQETTEEILPPGFCGCLKEKTIESNQI